MGKILHFLMDESIEEEQKEKTAASKFIYSIRKEFGRPLSPFECETLGMWDGPRSTSSKFNSSGS